MLLFFPQHQDVDHTVWCHCFEMWHCIVFSNDSLLTGSVACLASPYRVQLTENTCCLQLLLPQKTDWKCGIVEDILSELCLLLESDISELFHLKDRNDPIVLWFVGTVPVQISLFKCIYLPSYMRKTSKEAQKQTDKRSRKTSTGNRMNSSFLNGNSSATLIKKISNIYLYLFFLLNYKT